WSAGAAFLLHRDKTVEVQAETATLAGASRALRRDCLAAVRALQDKAQSPRCRSAGPMTEQGRAFFIGKANSTRMPMLTSLAPPSISPGTMRQRRRYDPSFASRRTPCLSQR